MTERACRMLPFESLRPLVHHHVMPCPGMGAHHSQASSSTSTSITCGPPPPGGTWITSHQRGGRTTFDAQSLAWTGV